MPLNLHYGDFKYWIWEVPESKFLCLPGASTLKESQ